TIETLTHHANDDYERMIAGDPGAESVFHWTREHKAVARRGSGPAEGPFIRGSGEGVGVHLLTGPVAIDNAEPCDVLEVRIPGVRVDHATIRKRENILTSVKVPARLHFGTMGLAPSEADFVSSIPPGYTGGNIDDWRVGKGARMYYPVAVPGAFFSVGDPHAAQGDSELGGTAIETSLTG